MTPSTTLCFASDSFEDDMITYVRNVSLESDARHNASYLLKKEIRKESNKKYDALEKQFSHDKIAYMVGGIIIGLILSATILLISHF